MIESDSIHIRSLHTLSEMRPAVDLQRVYWGDDADSVIPAHMLYSIAANGGHVLVAAHGDHMVGVLVGLLGTNPNDPTTPAHGNLHIYSKRMVVLPDYRHYGLGTRLKFAQRDFALAHGIVRVAWTFDPLLSRNAHLNVRKLGVISRVYHVNYYGTDNTGGLSPMGYSDRLFVEWWLQSESVQARAEGAPADEPTLDDYLEVGAVVINPTTTDVNGQPVPSSAPLTIPGVPPTILVEIPRDFPQLAAQNDALARHWQAHNRATLGAAIEQNYIVTDFVSTEHDGRLRAFYVLTNAVDE